MSGALGDKGGTWSEYRVESSDNLWKRGYLLMVKTCCPHWQKFSCSQLLGSDQWLLVTSAPELFSSLKVLEQIKGLERLPVLWEMLISLGSWTTSCSLRNVNHRFRCNTCVEGRRTTCFLFCFLGGVISFLWGVEVGYTSNNFKLIPLKHCWSEIVTFTQRSERVFTPFKDKQFTMHPIGDGPQAVGWLCVPLSVAGGPPSGHAGLQPAAAVWPQVQRPEGEEPGQVRVGAQEAPQHPHRHLPAPGLPRVPLGHRAGWGKPRSVLGWRQSSPCTAAVLRSGCLLTEAWDG